MFSKFLRGKDDKSLAALKIQFEMEFAKANRKFKKKQSCKNKKGRPPLGQLHLNVINVKENIDFTDIARKVATTRNGRRLHVKVAGDMENKNKDRLPVCFIFFIYWMLSVCFVVFFACFLLI